jgi:hypothetical protein
LIKHTNVAAKSAAELAEQARTRALDPALPGNVVTEARRVMDDAAFRRDRLLAAVTKLGERLEQLKDQEENERRRLLMTRPRLSATSWRQNWPTSIPPLFKSSPNCVRAACLLRNSRRAVRPETHPPHEHCLSALFHALGSHGLSLFH